MKILCLALAWNEQRFIPGLPARGARLFLWPDPEVCRLAGLVTQTDEFHYQDQRVEPLKWDTDVDLCLVRADFGHDASAREIWLALNQSGVPFLFFGPLVTALDPRAPDWAERRVVGDIINAWTLIREDATKRRLKPVYRASTQPRHAPARLDLVLNREMNAEHRIMNFVRGCSCPDPVHRFCPERLYYGTARLTRDLDEIVGELLDLPGKHVQLMDDDVASDPGYYSEVFTALWNYRRHWTVNASDALFRYPQLIQLLGKAGTKTVFLNETFLLGRLGRAVTEYRVLRHLYRRVKLLQSRRMLVGARVFIELGSKPRDYERIALALKRMDLDFIEPCFARMDENGHWQRVQVSYRPGLTKSDPAWVKHRFYTMGSILSRLARRPRRVGFYTTSRYLLPYSLAYRQNFLEGIPGP